MVWPELKDLLSPAAPSFGSARSKVRALRRSKRCYSSKRYCSSKRYFRRWWYSGRDMRVLGSMGCAIGGWASEMGVWGS
eukprot:3700181-Rhodomonas_salina.1